MTDDPLFDLPDFPPDLRAVSVAAPTFREQMTHAQMLLSWQRKQGLNPTHPPRNEQRFIMISEDQ